MTITAIAVMSSCEKDVNSKDLYAYIRLHRTVPNYSLTCAYQADGSILINDADKQTSAKFPFVAGLTRATVENTRISVALDASLVEQYNIDNNTEMVAVNADAISFDSKGELDVKQGTIEVFDTVRIDFAKLDPAKSYLLPINIKSVTSKDKGIVASSNTSTIFVKITTSICNNIDLASGVPTGTAIARGSWSVTASDVNEEANGAANMLDGNNTTIWHGTPNVLSSFVVDCGAAKAVKAFQLTSVSGALHTHNPQRITLEGSNDATTWDFYGTSTVLTRPSSPTAEAVESYIKIIHPQSYRYYRLQITVHLYKQYGSGVAELNALE